MENKQVLNDTDLNKKIEKIVVEYDTLGLVEDHTKDIGGIILNKEEYDDWE